jgi:hypothetical protein
MRNRVTQHLIGLAFLFLISLFVFCFSIRSLFSGRAGNAWFIYVVIGVISTSVLVTGLRWVWAISGSPQFEKVFPLSHPGPTSIDILTPHAMHGGKVVIYFGDSVKFYRGQISLLLRQNDGAVILGKVSLSAIAPSFRIPIPGWFKWFHVQEAGTTMDFWPRGSRRTFDPVIIPFTHVLAEGDALQLEIDVQNILKDQEGNKLENTSNSNFVTVCLKA